MKTMKYIWVLAALAVGGTALWILRSKTKSKASDEEWAAREELIGNVRRFSGCCQTLLMAVQTQNALLIQKKLDAWKKRMVEMPAICGYFEKLCAARATPLETAIDWLSTLERWGIQHGEIDSVFTITNDYEKLYIFDDVYPMGAEAKVIQPAWWLRTEDRLICIETGAAEIQ